MPRVGAGVFCAIVGSSFYQPVMTGLKSPVLPFAENAENTGGVYAAVMNACK
jgi:hypothetical protein